MKMIIEETISNVVEVEKLETVIEIADFDVGLRQLLEAQQSRTLIATDDITLEDSDVSIQFIDPGGASRDVNLPAVSVNNHGFVIVNTAATGSGYVLTVKTGATTLGTIPPNDGIGWFFSNGLVWKRGGGGGFLNLIEDGTDLLWNGEKVFASDDLTVSGTDLLWNGEKVFASDDLTVSGTDLLWNGDSVGQAYIAQGRLTLESGVPVSTTDQANKTTIYYTPFNGDFIDLYTNSAWRRYKFTERSLSTAGFTASRMHDMVLYDNAGTLTLEAVAWTNNTTRATALTYQDGVRVLSGATNKRYLGCVYVDASKYAQDTSVKLFFQNAYNKVLKRLYCLENTEHSYNGGLRPFNNTYVNNYLEFVVGENHVVATVGIFSRLVSGSAGRIARVSSVLNVQNLSQYVTQYVSAGQTENILLPLGYGFNYATETTSSTGLCTFYSAAMSMSIMA